MQGKKQSRTGKFLCKYLRLQCCKKSDFYVSVSIRDYQCLLGLVYLKISCVQSLGKLHVVAGIGVFSLQVGWFKLITWPERWATARNVCELELAHLAVPDSKQKVRVFLQIFKNYPDVLEQTILHKQVYIGVYSSGEDRNFSTVLGMYKRRFRITRCIGLLISVPC
jgi:hypothetical protein